MLLAFDGDATTNPQVRAARQALARELTGRGARVRVVDLPVQPGVNGPDDFLGRHGASAWWSLVDAAATVVSGAPSPISVRLSDVAPVPITLGCGPVVSHEAK